MEIHVDLENRDLLKKTQTLEQTIRMKDQQVCLQESKLQELKDQIQMIKEHYDNLHEIMKKDQKEKELIKEEFLNQER